MALSSSLGIILCFLQKKWCLYNIKQFSSQVLRAKIIILGTNTLKNIQVIIGNIDRNVYGEFMNKRHTLNNNAAFIRYE